MQLGRKNLLTVLRKKDIGLYLGDPLLDSEPYRSDASGATDAAVGVLLPRAEVPEGAKVGDTLEVFIYKDSEDRPIATTKFPPLEVGSVAVLKVAQVTPIGAFLDWGLLKELFLPFKEQVHKVREGEEIPVILYIDKSKRLCASMKIYSKLSPASGYQKNDKVSGIVYEIKKSIGAYVAVDGRFYGMIPKQELYDRLRVGDTISARVLRVRDDGKLDLSGRKKAYAQMDEDAERVLEVIKSYEGILPFTDKASPEQIKSELGLSKAAFKRAVGKLLKEEKITIGIDSIFLK